jgi:hypothetical protein
MICHNINYSCHKSQSLLHLKTVLDKDMIFFDFFWECTLFTCIFKIDAVYMVTFVLPYLTMHTFHMYHQECILWWCVVATGHIFYLGSCVVTEAADEHKVNMAGMTRSGTTNEPCVTTQNIEKVKLLLNSLFYRKNVWSKKCLLGPFYPGNDIRDYSGLSNSWKSHSRVGSGSGSWHFSGVRLGSGLLQMTSWLSFLFASVFSFRTHSITIVVTNRGSIDCSSNWEKKVWKNVS